MPQFTYNASALGAGGVIERDGGRVVTTIPSIASVALPPTGGEGKTVVSNYYSEELEFSHAETRVYGRKTRSKPGEEEFTTSTYVLIRGLRVFDKLRIGQMRATVTSTRGMDWEEDHPFQLDVSYTDVRIGTDKVIPSIDVTLRDLRRYEQLNDFLPELEGYGSDQRKSISPYVHGLAKRFNAKTPKGMLELAQRIRERRVVQGSVVEQLPEIKEGPVVYIPGLGTAYFGELMIKPGRRRLNLLRIDLGKPGDDTPRDSDDESVRATPMAFMGAPAPMGDELPTDDLGGSMTMGSVEGNGTPIGP
jgi:hypothetical protein